MNLITLTDDDVIHFWFEELTPADWFKKDDALDATIKTRFEKAYWAATRNELFSWRRTHQGRLSEIIILDQFSRNMFRDDPQAFAFDQLAVCLALEAIDRKVDQQLPIHQRKFIYMPLMHSESLLIHEVAVNKFEQPGLEDNLRYEHLHRDIIQRFGRYPHRNAVLGRASTAEEEAFLKEPRSSF
jgi:uncharacterized protein (DUF924 family)